MEFVRKVLNSNKLYLYIFQVVAFASKFLVVIVMNKINVSNLLLVDYEELMLIKNTVSVAIVNSAVMVFLQIYRSGNRKRLQRVSFNILVLMFIIQVVGGIVLWNVMKNYFISFLTYILVDNISLFVPYYLFVEGKNRSSVLFSIGYGVIMLLGISLPVILWKDLNLSFFFASLGLVIMILLVLPLRNFVPVYERRTFLYFVMLLFPLVLMYFITNGVHQVSSWIVRVLGSDMEFLLFRYGARELPITYLLANVISASNVVFIKNKGDKSKLLRNQKIFILFSLPITLVLLLSSEWLFTIFYKGEIVSAYKIFNIFLLLVLPRALFPQSILLGYNKNKVLLFVSVVEFIITILLSLILYNFLGIVGVALSVLVGHFIDKILLIAFCNKLLGIKLSEYVDIKLYTFMVVSVLFIFYISVFW